MLPSNKCRLLPFISIYEKNVYCVVFVFQMLYDPGTVFLWIDDAAHFSCIHGSEQVDVVAAISCVVLS